MESGAGLALRRRVAEIMMSSEPNRQNKPNGPGAASLQLAFNLVPFVGCFFFVLGVCFFLLYFSLLDFTTNPL